MFFFSGNGPLLAFVVENPHRRTHKSVVIPVVKNLLQISIMSSRKKVFSLKKKFCWLYSLPISFHSWWELDWGKYVFFSSYFFYVKLHTLQKLEVYVWWNRFQNLPYCWNMKTTFTKKKSLFSEGIWRMIWFILALW